jgi:hydrogenase maturation protease
MSPKTLVLGLGGAIDSDHGVGVYAAKYLQKQYSNIENVSYFHALSLNHEVEKRISTTHNLILIKTVQMGNKPGAVACHINDKLDDYFNNLLATEKSDKITRDLQKLFQSLRSTSTLPRNRALVTIQPQDDMEVNAFSTVVSDALTQVTTLTLSLIHDWTLQYYKDHTSYA